VKKILITGSKSGLGKFLAKELNTSSNKLFLLNRKNYKIIKKQFYDFIIHCAGKRPIYSENNEVYNYYKDNIKLTEKIVELKYKKIIFFSTIDVYEKNLKIKKENKKININNLKGIYPLTKLISENIISEKSKNFLILRVPTLIGKTMKRTSISKILKRKTDFIPYSKKSSFNLIDYKTIHRIIDYWLKNDLRGIFNVASKKNVKISDLSKGINSFGNNNYNVGNISINKIKKVNKSFVENSIDVMRRHSI
jgi:nucleoside-diphosphate-sugar epimerase